MRKTTVISVRGRDRAALLADPDFVYVGRAVWRTGWESSFWGNPYKTRSHHDARTAVERFERKIKEALAIDVTRQPERKDLLKFAHAIAVQVGLRELRGKVLGCWCCDWDGTGEPAKPCHAVVLAKLADSISEAPKS